MERPVDMRVPSAAMAGRGEPLAEGQAPVRNALVYDDAKIAAARAGDRLALEWLIKALLPRTRNLVRFLLPGDQDVDDFAQASLLEIVRALPGFEGRSALTTWADRIAVRETLRRVKRRRVHHARQQELLGDEMEAVTTSTLDERYHARRQVVAMLDQLPDEQRHVLVLHHVMGMSVPEVADTLGVPFDTAKSRLRLATQRLRQNYGGSDGGI